jgi:hypothetical protein
MKLLSLQSGVLMQGERAMVNLLLQSAWWSNPLLNPACGTVEPAPKYAGLVAYADGVSWNPGGTGAGMYFYSGAAWSKL